MMNQTLISPVTVRTAFFQGGYDIGAFEGTVSNDTINWNPSNTSWKRSVADVDVSGGWVHQQNRQWAFFLSQDGDAVTSEGSLGHAEGHFTGPVTFSLTWANIGSFEGTVKNGMIYWTPGGTSWERQAK